ncbi:hypothetical protein DFJ63DRAFT_312480 [Scheffersomyces coipomensis]|uniref:uncharacterized protein n=1 Tax=Scheffersomyces coipomensis TaxID=1788519 RepID=UPI00315D1CA6
MSSLAYNYFLKKTQLDHIVQTGPTDDPYFETIPDNELHFYQRHGAKRRRKLPSFIPEKDLKILESVKTQAYRLDLQLSIAGYRFGWAGIIGLFPWIGDLFALFLALNVLNTAREIEGGLPKILEGEMMFNIALDFGIGLIPFVGDLINIMYKCNSRNFVLLEKHLVHKYGQAHTVPVSTEPEKLEKISEVPPTHPAATHPATTHPVPPPVEHEKKETV